jgi:hypothetical protein
MHAKIKCLSPGNLRGRFLKAVNWVRIVHLYTIGYTNRYGIIINPIGATEKANNGITQDRDTRQAASQVDSVTYCPKCRQYYYLDEEFNANSPCEG